jgi:hypothetical protein
VRVGLDGVSGLVQELADVADAPVDRLGPDAEQDGDGDLRQGQALVEDGGQEPVGEGEEGPAAGARGGQPGTVAAALVEAGLPLLVMQPYLLDGSLRLLLRRDDRVVRVRQGWFSCWLPLMAQDAGPPALPLLLDR